MTSVERIDLAVKGEMKKGKKTMLIFHPLHKWELVALRSKYRVVKMGNVRKNGGAYYNLFF